MKKAIRIFLIFILSATFLDSYSQNLVPNYSFETYTTCPFSSGQISFAFPWTDPTNATPDYFDSCSAPGNCGVPLNNTGNRNAYDGYAYAGFTAYSDAPLVNFREYIQVKLTDTLSANKCYRLIYYVSVADLALYGVNKLSAYFSSTAVSCSVCFLPYSPQVNFYTPTVIDNGIGWCKVEGTFQAQGDEQYMTIGNFNNDGNTTVTIVNPGMVSTIAYYYIDSVSLTEVVCPIDIGIIENTNPIFHLFPNPAKEKLNIQLDNFENTTVIIYNMLGENIFKTKLNSKTADIDISTLDNGVYIISVDNGRGTTRQKIIKNAH